MKDKDSLIADIQSLKRFEIMPLAIKRDSDYHDERNFKAVTIEGENDIIATISPKYKLIQFSDVYLPAVNSIPDFEGEINTYKGRAELFIFPKDLRGIGIILRNSVDKSSAIEIRFCVKINDYCVTIPKQIKQFRKIHTGNVLDFTKDFLDGASKIQDTWNAIVDDYKAYSLDSGTIKGICQTLKLTKRSIKKIEQMQISNLWELFLAVMDIITSKRYKSQIHKQRKIDKLALIFSNFTVGVLI